MREAWRSMAGSVDGTFDLVFAARPDILGAKTQDLAEEMRASLVSAGVLNR
jgi:RNase P protein component